MNKFSHQTVRFVTSDKDLIFVKKLVLPVDVQQQVDELTESSYAWQVSGKPTVDGMADFHNGYIEIATTYDRETNKFIDAFNETLFSLCLNEFKKIDAESKLISVDRGLLARSHIRGKMKPASAHTDSIVVGEWSFLIHLKGTGGDTNFLNSIMSKEVIKSVQFEPLNLIMFPSLYAHQGLLPEDNTDRYIANFVAVIETSLNDKILSKSSDVIQKLAKLNGDKNG